MTKIEKTDVSLYIPVKNGCDFVKNCIESVLSQSYKNWRLYIVDNCSSDNIKEICKEYLLDKRVNYIANESDLGAIGNYNKCLDLCDTKYYAILSHDDQYWNNNAIEKCMKIMDRDYDIGVVYSHMAWIDEAGKLIVNRKFKKVGKVLADKIAKISILSCRNLFGVPLLIRKKITENIRYDKSLYHTCDIDFSIAISRGAYIYVIDRPYYAIRFHSANNTMRDFSKIKMELIIISLKNNLKISFFGQYIIIVNDFIMRSKKYIFYFYLDFFRKKRA